MCACRGVGGGGVGVRVVCEEYNIMTVIIFDFLMCTLLLIL